MSKDTNKGTRKGKERGYKIFKGIVHIFTIVLLCLLFRSLYVTQDGYHWLFGIGLVYYIFRLFVFNLRECRAHDMGIMITEYLELSHEDRIKGLKK